VLADPGSTRSEHGRAWRVTNPHIATSPPPSTPAADKDTYVGVQLAAVFAGAPAARFLSTRVRSALALSECGQP